MSYSGRQIYVNEAVNARRSTLPMTPGLGTLRGVIALSGSGDTPFGGARRDLFSMRVRGRERQEIKDAVTVPMLQIEQWEN